jgi:hypothetical protein
MSSDHPFVFSLFLRHAVQGAAGAQEKEEEEGQEGQEKGRKEGRKEEVTSLQKKWARGTAGRAWENEKQTHGRCARIILFYPPFFDMCSSGRGRRSGKIGRRMA